ncbi:MAG TPA: HupE/UreJ family protein, partial [Myxococcales bacterium]|nr:HupE/UreJ family protein [Myxococcales bacterium]
MRDQTGRGPAVFRALKAELFSLHRWGLLVCAVFLGFPSGAEAHGISEASRETMTGGGILDYIGLGAEHMVTGYDHLLFLFGVIFFLSGFRDIVRFITAFTLGHCITLLGATLLGITANAYLIDAVIALSVVYKGFENLDGFKKIFDVQAPNLLVMVFVFGLIHGLGLSTRLQELPLGNEGLVSRILAFNVGVELGQVAALSVMLVFFTAWRSSKSFQRFGKASNVVLVLAGLGLFVFQMEGFAASDHHGHHPASEAGHDPHHDPAHDSHHDPHHDPHHD